MDRIKNLNSHFQSLATASNTDHKCRRFEGKTVIVTGGGGSIGFTSAERMASEGANIVLTDIVPDEKL